MTQCLTNDYYLTKEKKCKRCTIDNCEKCSDDGRCDTCKYNYTKWNDGKKCVECSEIDGCVFCDRKGEKKCLETLKEYQINEDNGLPFKCNKIDKNCEI